MNRCLIVLFFVSFVAVSMVSTARPRSLANFYSLIRKTTGRNPLDYNNYGNWCGLGGGGDTVDEVDNCCKTHDHCYASLNMNECAGYFHLGPYFVSYKWEETAQESISCEGNTDECRLGICECDKAAALCFASHEYHEENKH